MAKGAARVGDPLSHGGSISNGSSNVFINGKPAARVDDSTSCGATISSGSPDVFIGDGGSASGPNVEINNASATPSICLDWLIKAAQRSAFFAPVGEWYFLYQGKRVKAGVSHV